MRLKKHWIKRLLLYICFDDSIDDGGKRILLTATVEAFETLQQIRIELTHTLDQFLAF